MTDHPLFPNIMHERQVRAEKVADWASHAPEPAGVRTVQITRGPNAVASLVVTPVGQSSAKPIALVHGGGWVYGSPRQSIGIARLLADISKQPVVNIGYRLAPEHPFPAAVEDVTRSLASLIDGKIDGLDPAPDLTVTGFSAGANLTLGAAITLRDQRRLGPARLVLFYPVCGLHYESADHRVLDNDPEGLTIIKMRDFATVYDRSGERDTRVDLLSANLSGLPQADIVCGDADILLPDNVSLYFRYRAAGVPASLTVLPGRLHGFAERWFEDSEVKSKLHNVFSPS